MLTQSIPHPINHLLEETSRVGLIFALEPFVSNPHCTVSSYIIVDKMSASFAFAIPNLITYGHTHSPFCHKAYGAEWSE
jgi:hypothetical protein